MTPRGILWPLLLALAVPPALAHEFWLEPTTHRPRSGEVVGIRVRVGDGFPGEPYPRNPDHLTRFDVRGPEGTGEVVGEIGADPAGAFAVGKHGAYVVAYAGGRTLIEIEPQHFETYLQQAGLDDVLAIRAALGASGEPGRELFTRCAKCLLASGSSSKSSVVQPVGLSLEIVPEVDPLALVAGDELSVRVLDQGQPLSNLLLRFFRRDDPRPPQSVRTDGQGRARLRLDAAGEWLVSGVHMIEAPAESGADWFSTWTSLTFEVAETRRPQRP